MSSSNLTGITLGALATMLASSAAAEPLGGPRTIRSAEGDQFGLPPLDRPAPTRLEPAPNDAAVEPLYRNIDPFYRNIAAFWRDINPFYGNIDPFWRDINPFYRNITAFTGVAPPAYDLIGTFWRDMGPVWYETDKKWDAVGFYPNDLGKYQELQGFLNDLVDRSETMWGAAVTARTGKSFRDGFATAIFAKHGVDLNNLATLEGMTAAKRSHFFLDWYDGLMDYSGADHIDHWMGQINWTPAITQIQGAGTGTIIGLLDATVANDADLASNITWSGGYASTVGGHGNSVAGLMVADHDGKGIMGIAPNASVIAYNPFDASGTASWADVSTGLVALKAGGANVINMSLGVPDWTLSREWKGVFANPLIAASKGSTVYVTAAGNDGKIQLTDIA